MMRVGSIKQPGTSAFQAARPSFRPVAGGGAKVKTLAEQLADQANMLKPISEEPEKPAKK